MSVRLLASLLDTDKPCLPVTINEPDSIDAGVTSVCISPDGRLVAAGSLDTIVRIWDVQTGQLVERLKGHRDSVYSVAFTPDGKGLVSGSLDKTLKYWDVRPILRGRDGSGAGAVTQGSASASKNGVKEGGEKGSQCTMNFTGHKVRASIVMALVVYSLPSFDFRITCCQLRFRMTVSGWSQAPRTAGYNSGMRRRQWCSVCCKDTKTLVCRLAPGCCTLLTDCHLQ